MQPDDGAGLADRQVTRWPVIWVPSEVASSSSSMTDMGTIARSWRIADDEVPRAISQARSAPVTVARMTSLTEPPCTLRTRR